MYYQYYNTKAFTLTDQVNVSITEYIFLPKSCVIVFERLKLSKWVRERGGAGKEKKYTYTPNIKIYK